MLLAGLLIAMWCLPVIGAPRAFVSVAGSDANVIVGCSSAAPCRTFQAAHDIVDPKGEVIALDTAGYGVVTIGKSVTIMSSPGVIGSIATAGNAVTISAGGAQVVLRGLNIKNTGGNAGVGIQMQAGDALSIENCAVSGFEVGVSISAPARVRVVDTIVRTAGTGLAIANGARAEVVGARFVGNGTGGVGLQVSAASGATTRASVSDSIAAHFGSGFLVKSEDPLGGVAQLSCIRCTASNNLFAGFDNLASTGTAFVMVSSSMASYNQAYGFRNVQQDSGTASFLSLGNNALHDNASGATSGSVTLVEGN
jgi:hypothetical protein